MLEGKCKGGGGGSLVDRTSLWDCAPAVGGVRRRRRRVTDFQTPARCCAGTQRPRAEDRSSDGNPDTNINTGSHFNGSSLQAPRCYEALGQQTQHGKHQSGSVGPSAGKLEGKKDKLKISFPSVIKRI